MDWPKSLEGENFTERYWKFKVFLWNQENIEFKKDGCNNWRKEGYGLKKIKPGKYMR